MASAGGDTKHYHVTQSDAEFLKRIKKAEASDDTTGHAALGNRDLPDQHPQGAITGLDDRLAMIEGSIVLKKGWFPNPEELRAAYPTAMPGNSAIVGSTDTLWVWSVSENDWVDSGIKGTVTEIVTPAGPQTGDVNLTLESFNIYSAASEIDDAVAKRHSHANKNLLDGLVSNGDGSRFLANDGTYRIPTATVTPIKLVPGGPAVRVPWKVHWDGKPLYRKLIRVPFSTMGSNTLYTHGITGFDYINVVSDESALFPDTARPLPVNSRGFVTHVYCANGVSADTIAIMTDFTPATLAGQCAYICLEYTLLSDNPVM